MASSRSRRLLTITAAVVAYASAGCTQAPDQLPPDLNPGQPGPPGFVQPDPNAAPLKNYPDTPTGFEEGSIMPDLAFIGYANFTDKSLEGLQEVRLSHFYNPTGDGVFPEGSPYGAGTPKPKALNMLISSVWCPPCNQEAKDTLPGEYIKYKPLGGHFLAILIDGIKQGVPATLNELAAWSDKYQPSYSMVLDPASKSTKWYPPYFPGNIIIRTRDMKIIRVEPGVPAADFWVTFDQVLDGSYPE